ncbi:MAG: hypothetical protein H0U60_00120 [Blastocatellia bacterium]|nr:hypothetical protein [Blastocatellia bacterium]
MSYTPPADAFTILHYDSLINSFTAKRGDNLLSNSKFEHAAFGAGWATTTNWSLVAVDTTTPSVLDGQGALAGSAANSGKTKSTLTSATIACSALTEHVARVYYGAPSPTIPLRLAVANMLKIKLQWYTAGMALLRTDNLFAEMVSGSDHLQMFDAKVTSPATAANVTFSVINIHQNSTLSGAVGGLVIDNLLLVAALTPALPPFIERIPYSRDSEFATYKNLKFSNHYQLGFKSAEFELYGAPEYLWNWAETALENHIKIVYQGSVFEGMVYRIDVVLNGVRYAVDLERLANNVKVEFGDKKHVRVINAESIEHWGRKDLHDSTQFKTRDAAESFARSLLRERKQLQPAVVEFVGASAGPDKAIVKVMGYINTLDWVLGQTYGAPAKQDIGAALATGQNSLLGVIRKHTHNDFISGNYANVQVIGKGVPPPKRQDMRGKSSLEMYMHLLEMGDSLNRVLCAGVWEDQQVRLAPRPTTARYKMRKSPKGTVEMVQDFSQPVDLASVRAGEFIKFPRPIPRMKRYVDLGDDPTALFIKEVEYSTEKGQLKFTTAGAEPLEYRIGKAIRGLAIHRSGGGWGA